MKTVARHAGVWILTWAALFWLWMLLVGEWNRMELVAAAVCATLAATTAEVVRYVSGMRFLIPLRLVPSLASALGMVVVDFGIVMGVLFRSLARREIHRGRFVARDYAGGGEDPRSFGKRAWTTLVACYSPNAYVIDIDPERDVVLLHDLVVFRKSEEPA